MDSNEIIEAIRTVEDPELGIDIYTLGLIYKIEIEDKITITMTYTNPLCPYGPTLQEGIKNAIKKISDKEVEIILTFEPEWQPPEELKAFLGI